LARKLLSSKIGPGTAEMNDKKDTLLSEKMPLMSGEGYADVFPDHSAALFIDDAFWNRARAIA